MRQFIYSLFMKATGSKTGQARVMVKLIHTDEINDQFDSVVMSVNLSTSEITIV